MKKNNEGGNYFENSTTTKTKTVYDITRPTVNINIYTYNTTAPYTRLDKYGKIA
jgi:hypothetical protein